MRILTNTGCVRAVFASFSRGRKHLAWFLLCCFSACHERSPHAKPSSLPWACRNNKCTYPAGGSSARASTRNQNERILSSTNSKYRASSHLSSTCDFFTSNHYPQAQTTINSMPLVKLISDLITFRITTTYRFLEVCVCKALVIDR